jgi:deferrochelatase/peroxidase EfeB
MHLTKTEPICIRNQIVYTGFSSYKDAEQCAEKRRNLVEVGFKDGNDNPEICKKPDLIEKKLHYYVDAGDEYKFIHSSDPGFRKYADELQKIKAK